MTEVVAVLGAGNMGTALAHVIAANGHSVRAWSIEHDVLEDMRDHRLNTKYLEGIRLHENVEAVWDLPQAVEGASLIIITVPSQVVRSLGRELGPLARAGHIVLNVAKGLEADSHKRLSEVLAEEIGDPLEGTIGSMGGPAIAIEMARGMPMAVIIGIPDTQACRKTQSLMQNEHLKVETTHDVCGLELCATLKNVYAIALGICDGLGYGANTKAFLASVALQEMCAIVGALGGERGTAFGLAGVGDLITTGYSQHSRNRTLGDKLGAGSDWQHFLRTHTVEGVGACRAIVELMAGSETDLPLLRTVHQVVHEQRPAPEAIRHFVRTFSYG